MYEEEKPKKKGRKPGQWTLPDVLLGLFGLAALIALTIAGFKAAKWVIDSYF